MTERDAHLGAVSDQPYRPISIVVKELIDAVEMRVIQTRNHPHAGHVRISTALRDRLVNENTVDLSPIMTLIWDPRLCGLEWEPVEIECELMAG